MSGEDNLPALPPEWATAITHIASELTPGVIKTLNRLIGAFADIPTAYVERVSARTRAKTQSYVAAEEAVARAVAQGIAVDEGIARRAIDNLVAKEYRKQENREAVAREFLQDLKEDQSEPPPSAEPSPELDDDWLNVFERFAEDASTERMQRLWGRVLAGETRKPGRFSMRTLRFLSEFSQRDAQLFADFCEASFGRIAPNALVKPENMKDLGDLIDLEAAGLITGASGVGLKYTMTFNSRGYIHLVEGSLAIQFHGTSHGSFETQCCTLTPIGQELVYLLPGRDPKVVARKVAAAMRQDPITTATLVAVDRNNQPHPMEVLWSPPTA